VSRHQTKQTSVHAPRFGTQFKQSSNHFPLWGQAVYPLWWLSLTKDMQTDQLLCWEWYDRHRA